MASDGPGKFKEKKNRASKPYDRPKGIIRRVKDSVTGLFSSSWLSGWMAAEEEEEANDPQQAGTSHISSQSRVAPQVNTLAPPGESFIFAQPVSARRSFRPIYPEEGEIEGNSNRADGVNVGASTSAGVRMNMPAAASVAIPTASAHLSNDTPSPLITGRRHPIVSSTPAQMYTARTKSHLEPRPLQLLSSSTPTGDDASEFSESSADTGVDASVIPRPDERDYQREILQLDDESLQTLRESLAKSAPVPPAAQPPSALPSLEETRKRPRDAEPDQTSIRAEGSLGNRSLFSDIDVSFNQPQPSALASKRPRFNVSTYGSSLMGDRSVLSDSSFKMSPFYPGKTMFGGASSYRKGKLQSRVQTARVQVKPKPAQTSDDGGLSQAARRILECLEQMSTPISDAKRIPTPILGQRGSFLDAASSYTAVYHRHRPSVRQAGPPTSNSSAPVKVSPQENLSASFLVNTGSGGSSVSTIRSAGATMSGTPIGSANSRFELGVSGVGDGPTLCDSVPGEEGDDSHFVKTPREDFSVAFPKASAETTAKFKSLVPVTSSATPTSSSLFNFGLPSNSSSFSQTFEFIPKPSAAPLSSDPKKQAGGKVKSKVVNSGRTHSKPEEEEGVEAPRLPAISLSMSALPQIDLTTPAKVPSSSGGFKFSSPEVVHSSSVPSEPAASAPVFKFSSPAAVVRDINNLDSTPVSSGPMFFNNYITGSQPKIKEVMKKDKSSSVGELREGSILDILKPKFNSPEKSCIENLESTRVRNSIDVKSTNRGTTLSKVTENSPKFGLEQTVSTINSVPKKPEPSQAFQGLSSFMKKSDEWECNVCMLRNKNTVEKCVACQSSKPGLDTNSKPASLNANAVEDPPLPVLNTVVGWGDTFKKSANEWECETCMLRNKNTSAKCAACETPKPGSKSGPVIPQESKVSENKDEKTNIGFGSMFAKAKGEWECATCLVRNKSDAAKCISCETPKPGAVVVSQAITGNFKFGANTNDSSTSSPFKFGVGDSQSVTKSTHGFSFGVSAKSKEESKSKSSTGFKFGVSEEVKSSSLTVGASEAESVKQKEKSECVSGSFSFGVPPADKTKEGPKDNKVLNFSFTQNTANEGNSENTNAVKPGFSFKLGNQNTPFAFGVGATKVGNKSVPEVEPASELKSGSVLKSGDSKSVFPASVFNKTLSSSHNEDSNVPPSFVAPKVSESASGKSLSSNTFTFGNGTAKAATSTPFSFTSPASKEEKAPLPSFTFGNKRENSDNEAPAKKSNFGSSGGSTLNNNVNSAPLFTFGSKENSLTTGSGFGPPPTSTPAFGAPAPASNATPNFQFGTPVPAATAPTPAFGSGTSTPAFGGTASAFGSNANSTPSFAFGQTAKKKSAGFDFGQAAIDSTSHGFNFGSAATNPVFQFGQKQNDTPANVPVFQFGAGGAVDTSAPFGGGETPFTPAPLCGRVVKKNEVSLKTPSKTMEPQHDEDIPICLWQRSETSLVLESESEEVVKNTHGDLKLKRQNNVIIMQEMTEQ